MSYRLDTREQRKKLPVRHKPYWRDVRRGLSIGYRKGVWYLREWRVGKHVQRRLGAADDTLPADGMTVLSWADAVKFSVDNARPTTARLGKYTVTHAWLDYRNARRIGLDAREQSIWDSFIEPKLGQREVGELVSQDLMVWLSEQSRSHGKRGQEEGADSKDQARKAQNTANRRWALLRAILNHAFNNELVPSDAAWRRVKPFKNVDRPRLVTASADQARALLGKLVEPVRSLAAGALYTGMRLSELMVLRAADYKLPSESEKAVSQLHVRHGKNGKERFIPLNAEGSAFFAQRVQEMAPGDPIFDLGTTDLRRIRMTVSRAMRTASAQLGIRPFVKFHDLRRSYGSLMLNAGAPLEAIQQVLGHADMRMTRRTYAHLLQESVANAVNQHLPSFTGAEDNSPRSKRRA